MWIKSRKEETNSIACWDEKTVVAKKFFPNIFGKGWTFFGFEIPKKLISAWNLWKIASTAATEHTSSGESPTGKIYGEFTKEKLT